MNLLRVTTAWGMALCSISTAAAQEASVADSLVAEFLEKGVFATWTPAQMFRHCEPLDEVGERALALLLEADLSRGRADDLARAWTVVLQGCRPPPPQIVDWFLDEVDADVRQGRDAKSMHTLWKGLELASSARVRDRLREYVLDTSLPEDIRVWAGRSMFLGADTEGKREEFTMAFQSDETPYLLAARMGLVMTRDDTDWTLRETARLVSNDPQLVEHNLFGQIAGRSKSYASRGQRDDLAAALEAIAERPSLSDERRGALIFMARGLRGGGG